MVGCWHGYLSGARYTVQLMPLPLTVSCFSKIQIGFTFLVLAYPGSPGQRAVKWVCACVCVVLLYQYDVCSCCECTQPHLHTIVNRSMELARTANEPFNYFLLLRALFRSIGGGSHDLLYQEFLPLLPSLLQGTTSGSLVLTSV